jgi:hypothetical protein
MRVVCLPIETGISAFLRHVLPLVAVDHIWRGMAACVDASGPSDDRKGGRGNEATRRPCSSTSPPNCLGASLRDISSAVSSTLGVYLTLTAPQVRHWHICDAKSSSQTYISLLLWTSRRVGLSRQAFFAPRPRSCR